MKRNIFAQLFKTAVLSSAIVASTYGFTANPTDQVIAIVDSGVILQSELDQALAEAEHQLQAQKQPLPPINYLKLQVLDQLILREAQLELVKRYGVNIDEKTLNDAVLNVAQRSGSSSLEAFQQKLDAMAPGTYAALRNRIAEDLAISRVRQQLVISRIKISDQDVNNFLKSPQGQAVLGSQVHVLHARIASENATPEQVNAVAKEVQQALNNSNDVAAIAKKYSTSNVKVDGVDMGYRDLAQIPAELAARITGLQTGQTSDFINARDGVHVLKLLERKSSEQKALVPQFLVRHILIQPSEVVSSAQAKQMIDSLYNRIQNGEDFAVLASTFSNDPGSASDGGSLGWVSPGVMVPEFEEKMKETPIGQVTKPFQTQFGWHILQVQDTRQKDMTNEYQERMARQILGERQFDSEADNWLREVRSNAYVEIKDPSLDKDKLQQQQSEENSQATN